MVLSFYCQESMEINRIFQGWQTFIQDNSSSNEFSYFDDYVSDIIVEQLDNTGKVQYAVKLIDAYPVMVAPLQLEWSSQNSFHNVQVTMAYRYWREEPLDINPFGNFLNVNSLYPNFDIGGALEKTGVAIFSRADGQFMSTVQQGMSFNRNIRNSGNKSKSSLSSSQQDGTSDRHMLNN
jgi:hypothetical protein